MIKDLALVKRLEIFSASSVTERFETAADKTRPIAEAFLSAGSPVPAGAGPEC